MDQQKSQATNSGGGEILYIMTLYSKYTRSLTFENLSQHLSALQDAQRERGKNLKSPMSSDGISEMYSGALTSSEFVFLPRVGALENGC